MRSSGNTPRRGAIAKDGASRKLLEREEPSTATVTAVRSPSTPVTVTGSTSSANTSVSCAPDAVLPTGTPVYAMWKDKFFYPGHVVTVGKNDKYEVLFEDGDSRLVKPCDLIVVDLVDLGEEVMAEEGEWSKKAVVIGHAKEGESSIYEVEFDGGGRSRVARGSVSLSHDQAQRIRRPSTCPAPLTDGNANVSLDNLVVGSRRRSELTPSHTPAGTTPKKGKQGDTTAQEQDEEPKHVPAKSTGKKGRRVAELKQGDEGELPDTGETTAEDTGSTSKGSKRKRGPQTSTPTPKRQLKQKDVSADSAYASTSAGSIVSEQVPNVAESPNIPARPQRASRAVLFHQSKKGVIPETGNGLFAGMAFVLSHVERTEEQKRQGKRLLRRDLSSDQGQTTDESSCMEEDDDCPYDKDHIIEQITAGGGTYVDPFDSQQLSSAKECFLISDTYQRTQKYFLSLASGMPCVSHLWIRDCCNINKIQDYRSYMLPAGLSIETLRLQEWRNSSRSFHGMSILVTSTNKRFVELWSRVLMTAGAETSTTLPKQMQFEDIAVLDLVVADSAIPSSYLKLVQEGKKTIVSSEYVVQSLIQGARCDPTAHSRYAFDYTP